MCVCSAYSLKHIEKFQANSVHLTPNLKKKSLGEGGGGVKTPLGVGVARG